MGEFDSIEQRGAGRAHILVGLHVEMMNMEYLLRFAEDHFAAFAIFTLVIFLVGRARF
jgi:hypothetical protein